jgi:hypothetical protein
MIDMQTDREKTIEKLWQNSAHGTRWADVAAAYDAGKAAERKRIKAKLRDRHAESAHLHPYYACMAVELFGPFDGT